MSHNPHSSRFPMYFPPSQFSHRFGTQFFTLEITEYKVIDEQISPDSKKTSKFAVFKFEVKRGKQVKILYYRYSEIRELHEYLCASPLGVVANMCKFPSKTFFKNLENKFLNQRRKQLQSYFHQLLSSSRSITQTPCVRQFLQLDSFKVKPWYKE